MLLVAIAGESKGMFFAFAVFVSKFLTNRSLLLLISATSKARGFCGSAKGGVQYAPIN